MNSKNFLSIYIPALELALKHDDINYGFNVYGPDFYIQPEYLNEVENYIDNRYFENMEFIDMVGYYFDAKSHSFPDLEGIDIDLYKIKIINEITSLKAKFNLL